MIHPFREITSRMVRATKWATTEPLHQFSASAGTGHLEVLVAAIDFDVLVGYVRDDVGTVIKSL